LKLRIDAGGFGSGFYRNYDFNYWEEWYSGLPSVPEDGTGEPVAGWENTGGNLGS
jgi:hypothetical protein